MKAKYNPLFTPFSIGNTTIKNRFVMAPMGTMVSINEYGAYTQQSIEYYVARAKGGVGLIITGANWVENDVENHVGMMFPCPTTSPASYMRSATEMTDRVHAYGTKIFLQLTAGLGRAGIPRKTLMGDCIAPSPVGNRWKPDIQCREMTVEEIQSIVKSFAKAAKIAKRCGFDGIEIHAVHEGYLLDCFTMSLFNQRKDQYGGDISGRLRFAVEIIKGVKESCGSDFPVVLRLGVKSYIKALRQGGLPGESFQEMGRDVPETLAFVDILEKAGCDAFDADAGSYDSWYWAHPPMYFEQGVYLPLSAELKKKASVPVIVAGFMDDPDLAVDALHTGKLDAVGLGRPVLSDADYVNKLRLDAVDTIRPCLGCHDGCFGRSFAGKTGSCAVNPECARELLVGVARATDQKKVVVVGGGPGGMEAARVSAMRGHAVTLFEGKTALGGNLVPGGMPSFKKRDGRLVSWYDQQLQHLGVNVQLGTRADRNRILSESPDILYIASGSTPVKIPIPGNTLPIYMAEDVLMGQSTGQNCVVIGGGLVGCELALHLAELGKSVSIIEAQEDILLPAHRLPPMNEFMLRDLLAFRQIAIHCNSYIRETTASGAVIECDGQSRHMLADTIILAVGYRPERALFEELQFEIPHIYLLGDAKQVRGIMDAIWEGYELARTI